MEVMKRHENYYQNTMMRKKRGRKPKTGDQVVPDDTMKYCRYESVWNYYCQ